MLNNVSASILPQQKGASLIEVTVASLVLGVGMLGVMSLQTQSLQYSHQAYLLSQANFLAQDISERIRSNSSASNAYLVSAGASVTSGSDCTARACDASALAAWDLSQWQDALHRTLPQGRGEIKSQGGGLEIVVSFDDGRHRSGAQQVVFNVQL